jgi:hypothetical protein
MLNTRNIETRIEIQLPPLIIPSSSVLARPAPQIAFLNYAFIFLLCNYLVFIFVFIVCVFLCLLLLVLLKLFVHTLAVLIRDQDSSLRSNRGVVDTPYVFPVYLSPIVSDSKRLRLNRADL